MKREEFRLTDKDYATLSNEYPNTGKNAHVGRIAVEIAKRYFRAKGAHSIEENVGGIDLKVSFKDYY